MRPTIKDVAKRANVSTATVSLVLHNHQRISNLTKKKVRKAIKELNYHPSHPARRLVGQSTGNIAFLLTDDHFLRTEPFYTGIFLGTEFEARQSNYYILLTTIPTQFGRDDALPRCIREMNVDGLIVAGKVPDILIERVQNLKLPTVFIDFFPKKGSYSAVLIDNLNGGLQATEHLIKCGHKKIGFIGGDIEHPSIRDRFTGFKMAIEKHNLVFDINRVLTTEKSTSKESGYHAAQKLHQNKNDITAIFACNDAMAMGAMRFYKNQNLQIPQDISIIGFDDIDSDPVQDPPLTTMKVPKLDMGTEAFRMMVDILKKNTRSYRKILMPVEIIVRDSTCNAQ
jgi:LacI family transcriptional regulator